jgi:predicted phage terminase large subunit-like protein
LQPQAAPTPEDYAFSRLICYAAYQWPQYRDAAHHRLIARHLEAVERGDIKRLMITMPPRHGKSMLASEFFPAWYLGRNPDHYVVTATYSQDLADDFGRKVKNQIADDAFKAVFPGVTLANDSKSAKRFNVEGAIGFEQATNLRGAYYAVGVGGPLTGRGAHLLLIDDPVKNREDADSETIRKKMMDWYTSTAYTRLMPGGRVVIIQTRWHEADLSGWLQEEHGHEGWVVLDLPAISNDGKALWPEQYDLEALEAIKRAIGPREWSALYQQRPQPDEGGFFQRAWFKEWDKKPLVNVYGTSDYAVTDEGGDYTVHRVWGVDAEDNLYRLDGWRGQTSADVWIEQKLNLIAKWKPLAWFGEGGVIQKAIEPMLRKRMLERKVFCRLEWLSSIHDKPTRARGFQARAAMGKVFLEKGADLSEFLVFPAGKHDDEVDTASMIGRALDMAHPAIVPAVIPVRNPSDYRGQSKPSDISSSAWG